MVVAGLADRLLAMGADYMMILSHPVSAIFFPVLPWPSICVGTSRYHDREKSAWWS